MRFNAQKCSKLTGAEMDIREEIKEEGVASEDLLSEEGKQLGSKERNLDVPPSGTKKSTRRKKSSSKNPRVAVC